MLSSTLMELKVDDFVLILEEFSQLSAIRRLDRKRASNIAIFLAERANYFRAAYFYEPSLS